ncbi:choice-of-anchor J domain-containing protein [Massilia sp. LXY-6]|uniref:choice-of-anchor J domain-containing protein n=1 Tax=Massilia sp. LXY-6 TaxID=3379823 RepID=UPI003EE36078
MKPVNSMIAAAAFSLATLGAPAAQAGGVEVLNEGFGSVSGLNGWAQVNHSVPAGDGWFQGNPELFAAQSGAADAYAAVNFLGAANGSGTVDNWLITPTLNLSGTTVLSFFTRHDATPGFNDMLEVRFSSGSGLDPAGFTTVLTTLGGTGGYPTDWEEFSAILEASGSGRFAFRYFGPADTLNYVGLDSVRVVTAVPEPSTWAMLGAGFGLVGLRRRKHQA